MINFRLKQLDDIIPFGQEPELSLHWFGLTDGDLWLTFGEETIYQYSKEALNYFKGKPTPYNNYPLIRFIEDFTELFDKIREPIPEDFYQITKDLKEFYSSTNKWLDIRTTEEDRYDDFYFNGYDKLISWIYKRTFDSGHLIGGPYLSFFRCNNKIRIVWQTEHVLDNGIRLWTANDGNYEMEYADFIDMVRIFGNSFFVEMGKQTELALIKDWGKIKIDKKRLVQEHQERKDFFFSSLAMLEHETKDHAYWEEIKQLFNQMKKDVM